MNDTSLVNQLRNILPSYHRLKKECVRIRQGIKDCLVRSLRGNIDDVFDVLIRPELNNIIIVKIQIVKDTLNSVFLYRPLV